MRNAVPGAVIAILVAAAGCSAGSAAPEAIPTTTIPSSTAPTSTSPTPTVLSREAAARRYLEIVKPYNDALERLEQAINAGRPYATLRPLAGATAGANRGQVAALRAVPWPADVQPAVAALVAESERAQPHWDDAATTGTRNAVIEAVLAAAKHDGSDAAATIRTLLALDQYDEGDHGG